MMSVCHIGHRILTRGENQAAWQCPLRGGQGGNRKLRLFSLPPCRLRRREIPCLINVVVFPFFKVVFGIVQRAARSLHPHKCFHCRQDLSDTLPIRCNRIPSHRRRNNKRLRIVHHKRRKFPFRALYHRFFTFHQIQHIHASARLMLHLPVKPVPPRLNEFPFVQPGAFLADAVFLTSTRLTRFFCTHSVSRSN